MAFELRSAELALGRGQLIKMAAAVSPADEQRGPFAVGWGDRLAEPPFEPVEASKAFGDFIGREGRKRKPIPVIVVSFDLR